MKNILRFVAAMALAGGVMIAGEPGAIVHVDLRDVPMAEALRKIEDATGQKFEAPASVVEGRKLSLVRSGTSAEILAALDAALDNQSIALLPVKDSTAKRLQPFTRTTASNPRPVARGRRLSVDVVEGSVTLSGGQGSVTVRAGERSWVTSGALPAPPVPIDTATVAPWRFPEAQSSGGVEARVPLSEIHYTLRGYTETGDPIVEYEVNGVKKVVIVENGELIVPVPVKIERGSK